MQDTSQFTSEYELLLPPSIDMEIGDEITIRSIVRPPSSERHYIGSSEGTVENVELESLNEYLYEKYGAPGDAKKPFLYRPPVRFGPPLTSAEQEDMFARYREAQLESPKQRIAVIGAKATSSWFRTSTHKKKGTDLHKSRKRTKTSSSISAARQKARTKRRYRTSLRRPPVHNSNSAYTNAAGHNSFSNA